MLEHNGERWGDKVRIIGVSIDKDTETVNKHVKAKGWEKVEHLHRAGSSADDLYGVQGVPHVVLIDGEGKIAFVGHPATRELEKDIETLIKGEKLKGVSAGGDDEDEDEGGYEELDVAKISAEMQNFKEKVKTLANKDSVKKAAQGMMRDFVVAIRQTKYDPTTDKFLSKYENINVLVGPQEFVDTLKNEIEEFLKSFGGSFKTDFRVRAM